MLSVQVYLSSFFMLPSKVHKTIDSYLRAFLWDSVGINMKKVKVSWVDICVPKDEKGFNIMKSKDWNKIAMMKHLWNVIQGESRSL